MWCVEGPVAGSSYTPLGMMNLQMGERAGEKVRPQPSRAPFRAEALPDLTLALASVRISGAGEWGSDTAMTKTDTGPAHLHAEPRPSLVGDAHMDQTHPPPESHTKVLPVRGMGWMVTAE